MPSVRSCDRNPGFRETPTRLLAFVAERAAVGAGVERLAAVPAESVIKLPDSIPFEFAATFNVAYGTAYLALCRQAGLQAGETVLVLGAAGGTGLAAVEILQADAAEAVAGNDRLVLVVRKGVDVTKPIFEQVRRASCRKLAPKKRSKG